MTRTTRERPAVRAAGGAGDRGTGGQGGGTPGWVRAAAASAAFAAFHSATASSAAKDAAERWLGPRPRNALYRPAYNLLAAVTSAALLRYVRRQPDRTLYRVGGFPALLMRLGQLAALAYGAAAVWRVGPLKFVGLPGVVAWAMGAGRVPREPEGQSPPPGAGLLPPEGPFRLSRHPLNFVLLPLFWLNPRMTANLAAFSAVTTLYAYLGSLHTDRRMRRRYGSGYEPYRARVPLLVPGAPPPGAAARLT